MYPASVVYTNQSQHMEIVKFFETCIRPGASPAYPGAYPLNNGRAGRPLARTIVRPSHRGDCDDYYESSKRRAQLPPYVPSPVSPVSPVSPLHCPNSRSSLRTIAMVRRSADSARNLALFQRTIGTIPQVRQRRAVCTCHFRHFGQRQSVGRAAIRPLYVTKWSRNVWRMSYDDMPVGLSSNDV